MKKINLQNKRFGKLTVLYFAGLKKLDRSRRMWVCLCSCGKKTKVSTCSLQSGNTTSCGCFFKEYMKGKQHNLIHGMKKTKIYQSWADMKRRAFFIQGGQVLIYT